MSEKKEEPVKELIYKVELSFKDERWYAKCGDVEEDDGDGVQALNKVLHRIDNENYSYADVKIVEHPFLTEVNERHKFAPFKINGCNYCDDEKRPQRPWEETSWGWDFGWSSVGFGFDSGFSLEKCINECHEYGMSAKPKMEHFTLGMSMGRYIEKKLFPEIFKNFEDKKMRELLKEVFWRGYHLGEEHKEEHYEALTNPDYDFDKWTMKEKKKCLK